MAKLSKYDVVIASRVFIVRASNPDSACNVAIVQARQAGIQRPRIEDVQPSAD